MSRFNSFIDVSKLPVCAGCDLPASERYSKVVEGRVICDGCEVRLYPQPAHADACTCRLCEQRRHGDAYEAHVKSFLSGKSMRRWPKGGGLR